MVVQQHTVSRLGGLGTPYLQGIARGFVGRGRRLTNSETKQLSFASKWAR